MLSAYVIKLVFWLRQVYYSLVFHHCGGSEAYLTSESIRKLLENIHSFEYESPFHFAEWCQSSTLQIDVTKW